LSELEDLTNITETPKVIKSTSDVNGMEEHNLVIANAQKFGGKSNTSLLSCLLSCCVQRQEFLCTLRNYNCGRGSPLSGSDLEAHC
jgi:hypothetical protein